MHDLICFPFVADTFGTCGQIAKYTISSIYKRWAITIMENIDQYINCIYQ